MAKAGVSTILTPESPLAKIQEEMFTFFREKFASINDYLLGKEAFSDKREKDSELERRELQAKIAQLAEKIRVMEMEHASLRAGKTGSYVSGRATPALLENTIKKFSDVVSSYSRTVVQIMKKNGVDSMGFTNILFPGVVLDRDAHVKYVIEAFICEQIFRDFENETFQSGGEVTFLRSSDRQQVAFQTFEEYSNFGRLAAGSEGFNTTGNDQSRISLHLYIARLKYDQVHCALSQIPNLSVADLNVLMHLLVGGENNILSESHFMDIVLITLALHNLAFAFEPPASIFRVQRGARLDPDFMEALECNSRWEDRHGGPTIQFMARPGFRVRGTTFPCLVYPKLAETGVAAVPRHPPKFQEPVTDYRAGSELLSGQEIAVSSGDGFDNGTGAASETPVLAEVCTSKDDVKESAPGRELQAIMESEIKAHVAACST